MEVLQLGIMLMDTTYYSNTSISKPPEACVDACFLQELSPRVHGFLVGWCGSGVGNVSHFKHNP